MFDWLSRIFNSKPNETLEPSEEEKKRSDDGFVNQVLIFPNANNALNPTSSSDNADAGSSDGGGGGEKDLVPTLELIKTAVLNGELDTQIDAAANKLRDGFAQ